MKTALAGIILYALNLNTIPFSFELDSVFNTPMITVSGVPRGGLGVQPPPSPEIPKVWVESSIAWARRTGVSISFL